MSDYFSVGKIEYEGRGSDNPFAFKFYNPKQMVGNKTMEDHLRFSIAFWHTMTGSGQDPFGMGTMMRPWDREPNDLERAKVRVKVLFELLQKLQVPYFAFHDRDIAPEGDTLRESNRNLDAVVDVIEEQIKATGVRLLWGTANLFSNPRYAHGAATSPSADSFAYAAAQVKKAIEVTARLGGQGYVFWGGREGYETLLNTNMKLEQENMARLLGMAVDYASQIGFKGQFLIEPKPKEPTKHQYDFDTATVYGFLKKFGLDSHFKVNIETNHATLAGHTVQHELRLARDLGILGSVDANQGDLLLGWDTDQFPTDIYVAIQIMYEILKNGGIAPGGLNFDAKLRRGSYAVEDMFHGHIAGMDTFARGLTVAHAMIEDGKLDSMVEERYASYTRGIGAEILGGKADFKSCEAYILDRRELEDSFGRQELMESILNTYI
jgi:xylose isomerase